MIDRRKFLAGVAAASVATQLSAAPKATFVLDAKWAPQEVKVKKIYAGGQILVVPSQHFLYYVTEPGKAIRYGVGVGRAGLEFQGTAVIGAKKEWPTWKPTAEMIARNPAKYGRWAEVAMPGGPSNPLGPRALYLFQNGADTFFRIHGTIEPQSIGQSVSNGCIRMINEHVIDLYERVPLGTIVTVI